MKATPLIKMTTATDGRTLPGRDRRRISSVRCVCGHGRNGGVGTFNRSWTCPMCGRVYSRSDSGWVENGSAGVRVDDKR